MTAEEIRERIQGYEQDTHEAFRRAFERDKEALRAMGIPLEVVATDPFADQADGYIISKERYCLPALDLQPEEVAALKVAADAVLGPGDEAAAGLLKMSMDGPVAPLDGPRVVVGADVAAEQPLLSPLYGALLERRPVIFSYLRAGETEAKMRTVEPYALVHRRGNWYLVGHDRERDAVRAFKVSRIDSGPSAAEGSYAIPAGFDAARHLGKEAWEVGPGEPSAAVIRFDSELAWWPEQNMPSAPITPAPGGAADIEIPVANVDALVSWIIGFGGAAEIISPPDARRRLVQHLAGFGDGP